MYVELLPRPTLTTPAAISAALDRLSQERGSTEAWRALTERFTIDLDAAAAVLPLVEPEPIWLPVRG